MVHMQEPSQQAVSHLLQCTHDKIRACIVLLACSLHAFAAGHSVLTWYRPVCAVVPAAAIQGGIDALQLTAQSHIMLLC